MIQMATITGWGSTDDGTFPNQLQTLNLKILADCGSLAWRVGLDRCEPWPY